MAECWRRAATVTFTGRKLFCKRCTIHLLGDNWMAIVRYDRAIASVSWIDWHSGLPEVDTDPPGAQVARSYLMGAFGFRFVNYLEVWASYDTASETMVGYGFSPAS